MAMYRRPGLRRKSCDNKTITAQVRSDAGGQVPMSADCSPVDNSIGFNYPILTCGTCKGIVASPKFGRNSQETIVQRITDSESKDSLEQASFCGWIAPRASEFFRPTSSFEDEDDNEVIVLKRKRDCKIAVRPKFALPEHFVDKLKLLKRVEYQLSHDSPLRNLKEDSQKEPITVKKRKKLCFVDDPETAKRQKKSMSQRASQNRVLGCDERRNESVKGYNISSYTR
ncbi:unnamed protein product [Notodromas monacha]|uniref:Uncharacterized protein n=1 Tax=Notodromas monacha TaxID=399045 RepID=A0A7R9BV09_9CRUS|nr:unnamed protein product [Notodromas monacha]CAG0921290.1 unnamed protein product [Notodromas monacha]